MRKEEKILSSFIMVIVSLIIFLAVCITRNTIEHTKLLEENKFHISRTSGTSVERYYTNSEIKYNKDCCEFTDSNNRKIKISGPYSVIEH